MILEVVGHRNGTNHGILLFFTESRLNSTLIDDDDE